MILAPEYVLPENVKPPEWQATYILSPDMRLLHRSLLDYGWLHPIIVRKADMSIIDGTARWMIASEHSDVLVGGKLPIAVVDCDVANAIIMHIRLNRARGNILAKRLSGALVRLVEEGFTDELHLCKLFGMSIDEYDALSEPRLIKSKKLVSHEYSRAWIPVEVSADKMSSEMKFERPPTPDQ